MSDKEKIVKGAWLTLIHIFAYIGLTESLYHWIEGAVYGVFKMGWQTPTVSLVYVIFTVVYLVMSIKFMKKEI